MILKLKTKS